MGKGKESCAPRSVLGPTLFLVYINDLPDCCDAPMKLYADDSKLLVELERGKEASGAQTLQRCIDAISNWFDTWLMPLNVKKCKIMHIGKRNPRWVYYLPDPARNERHLLESTLQERDLGVLLTDKLRWSEHVAASVAKAHSVVRILKNTFRSRDPKIWRKLHTTYVRPLVEYAVQAWNPHLKSEINRIEQVQRTVTRIPHLPGKPSYAQRCRLMNLPELSCRRARGDLIQMYKCVHGLDEINWSEPLVRGPRRENRRSRLHPELVRNCSVRSHYFLNRVAQMWNKLPDEVAKAGSLNEFKNKIDRLGLAS
jgi:ribonucleases P/MRP protein subunit RPP40